MRRILSLLSILALSLSLASCGKSSKPIVSDLDVETTSTETEQFVVTDFKLEIGQTELPFLDLPLPKNYGALRLYRLGGENRITVDLNLTEVLKLPVVPGTLPNGNPIPVDTNGAGVIVIDIEGINAKVYVARNEDVTLVGFAISIKQLDGLGESIGNAGVFPNFDIGDVQLTAGIFTSEVEKQTGIAAFANLAGLFDGSKGELALRSDRSKFAPIKQRRLSKRKKRRLYKKLRRITKKNQVLTLH